MAAAVLELLLRGSLSVESVLSWLKQDAEKDALPEQLKEKEKIRQDFIPFFFNHLREQTAHLLENNKFSSTSPAKIPVQKYPASSKLRECIQMSKCTALEDKTVDCTIGCKSNLTCQLHKDSFCRFCSKEDRAKFRNGNGTTNVNFGPDAFSSSETETQSQSHYSSGFQIQPCMKRENYNSHQLKSLRVQLFNCLSEVKQVGSHSEDFTNQLGKNPLCGFSSAEESAKDMSCEMIEMIGNVQLSHTASSGIRSKTENKSCTAASKMHSRRDFSNSHHPKQKLSLGDYFNSTKVQKSAKSSPGKKKEKLLNHPSSPVWKSTNKNRWKKNFQRAEAKLQKEQIQFCLDSLTEFPPPMITLRPQPCEMKPSRRIKPTPVVGAHKTNEAFVAIEDADKSLDDEDFDNKKVTEESGRPDKRQTFSWKRERDQKGNRRDVLDFQTNLIPLDSVNRVNQKAMCPSLSEVTEQSHLKCLIDLYSGCLQDGLSPNITVELFFLVQLLVVKVLDHDVVDQDSEQPNYFSSIHNAVYFAVCVLEKQLALLTLLDNTTIKLLAENPRVAEISPIFRHQLIKLYEKAPAITLLLPGLLRSPIRGVSFQPETDNRNNFPNDRSFEMFKRQRDAFYEFIREWEDNHLQPGWSMVERMGTRIHRMILWKAELASLIQFAKLFQSQLIIMCKGDYNLKLDREDDNIGLLSQLKRTNPEKFQRLQERFITPLSLSASGSCPPPTFYGHQEFFRDFIVAASNHVFTKHLADAFRSKVIELDDAEFVVSEVEAEDESNVDEEQKTTFVSYLMILRLLGKFLGFVTFLPYHTTERLPESLHQSYLAIRNKCLPDCDILEKLDVAAARGQLTLTVPWVVEYTSMMDSTSPLLTYFHSVLIKLLSVYRYVWSVMKTKGCSLGRFFLIALLGWLFENSVVLDGLFFSHIEDKIKFTYSSATTLDNQELVDHQLLYTCCPYLGSIRCLLLEFASGISSKTNYVRKITPVAAADSSVPSVDKQIQLQLQENFFHNQPASLKRTVEFVAERTASNYIKRFRHSHLQVLIQKAKNQLDVSIADKTEHQMTKIAQEQMESVTWLLNSEVKRIQGVLEQLLSEEYSKSVKVTAAAIMCQLAENSINHWMIRHVTCAMFVKEMSRDALKPCRESDLVKVSENQPVDSYWDVDTVCHVHNSDLISPSDILCDFKDILKNIVAEQKVPDMKKLQRCLQDITLVLNNRQDILSGVLKSFGQLVIYSAMEIIIKYPFLWTDIQDTCMALWKEELLHHSPFHLFSSVPLRKQIEENSPNKQLSKTYLEAIERLLLTLDVVPQLKKAV